LHSLANPAYLKRFLCSGLLRVAPYCVPGGIRVVSRAATAIVRRQVQWHALATFRATIRRHRFLGVAEGCKTSLDKPIPLLAVARRFSLLRSGWCQQWCRTVAGTLLPCESPRTLTAARRSSECRWRSTARSMHHRQRNLTVPTMVTVFYATVLNGDVRTTGPKNPLTKHAAEAYPVLYAWPKYISPR
jgi:hypothetical protein